MGVNVQDRGGKFYVSVFHKGRRGGKTFNDREAAKAYRAWMELTLLTDEAKAWGSLDGADTGTGASVTFRDYFKRWMATRTLAHNTVRNYWNIFTLHVDPVIGGMPLKGITYSVVRDLMLSMKQSSLSGDTTRSYFAPVRGCLQEAVREGLLPSNPASRLGLSRTKRDPDSETVRAYTEEEIERILRQTQSRFQADAIVRIGVGAGLRESEICGLQTGDIDLERGSLTVRRQACEGRVSLPKYDKVRTVEIPPKLVELLRAVLAAVEVRNLTGPQTPWLFTNRAGTKPLSSNTLKYVWYSTVAKSGVRRLSFHCLRHTYASQMLKAGIDLRVVSKQLGHADVSVTLKVYAHLYDSQIKGCADVLDIIL